jgi:hypothetical protein
LESSGRRALVGSVQKFQGADSPGACRYEAIAEWSGVNAEVNFEAFARTFEFTRRDSLDIHEKVVQAGRTAESNFERRFQDRSRIVEELLGGFDRKVLKESFGTDARPAGEEPLEVIGTKSEVGG